MLCAFRAIQFGLVALTLVLFGSVASAQKAKPKIAVLGLEAVVGANGQIDPADTAFAKELTKELRSRANNSKNYDLTKDSRELVDEKLMNNCGSEQATCMGPIGANMGADVLLFGRVANAKGGYKVTLTLVDTKKRSVLASDPNATITQAELKNPALGNWVREHYKKLTGESSDGQLVIIAAGAGAGRVIVNGDTKDTLRNGTATISLPEGNRYRVGVEADGFRLWEQENVQISADKTTELKPELVKSKPIDIAPKDTKGNTDTTTGTDSLTSPEGPVSETTEGSSKLGWKVAAGVSFGAAAVTGAFWIIKYRDYRSFDPDTRGLTFSRDGKPDNNIKVSTFDRSDCKGEFAMAATDGGDPKAANNALDSACSAHRQTFYFGAATVVFAAAGSVALYMALRKDGTEERPAGAGRRVKKKKNLIVTPVVTPDGTGATLRFDW